MHPPAHVCRALYEKYPDLRLAWHGLWGKFCVVRLSPKRMTQMHSSAFLAFGTHWDLEDIINDHGDLETVARSKGPVFNKSGGTNPDWDLGDTDVLMVAKVDDPNHVFGGRVVRDIIYESREQQLRNQAKAELEKGKMLKQAVWDRQAQTIDKVKYYTNRHDGITINTSKKHLKEAEKQEAAKKVPRPDRGLEYYHVDKRGLGKYLDE